MRVAEMRDLNDWDSFWDTAQALGVDHPTLWGYAIEGHVVDDPEQAEEWALVSTAPFSSPWGAYTFWRNRWPVENSGFRELKEGWLLEKSLWTFHNPVVAAARVAFTLVAFNVAQVAKSKAGARLARNGVRRAEPPLWLSPDYCLCGGCVCYPSRRRPCRSVGRLPASVLIS